MVRLPDVAGRYRVYLSLRDNERGWWYERGLPFLLLEGLVDGGAVTVERLAVSTLRRLSLETWPGKVYRVFTEPALAVVQHRGMMRSLIRREFSAYFLSPIAYCAKVVDTTTIEGTTPSGGRFRAFAAHSPPGCMF